MAGEHYVYGIHAVAALLKSRLRRVYQLYVKEGPLDNRLQALVETALAQQIVVSYCTPAEFRQRFSIGLHQGVVASAEGIQEYHEQDIDRLLNGIKTIPLILILDGVTDPHNLGACLRSADAAGVDMVIIPKDKSATITPVVSKVASGAVESIPLIRVTNLVRTMEYLKHRGIWIYGAAGEVSDLMYDFDYTIPLAMIMGAEGKGLRRLTRDHCDGLFSLPMLGSVSSLNVSVATGICLYEVVRQRSLGLT